MTPRKDALRWTGSLAVVLGVHAGAVAGMLAWTANSAPPLPPPAAVMIDLAPLVQAPEPPPEPPPEPEPMPEPPTPEPEPEPEPVAEEPPPVPLPPKPVVERKPPPPPKPVAAKPPPPRQEPPPPAVEAPPARQAVAPRRDEPVVSRSNAVPTWQGALLAHLERHKRYPRAAQARRQEGVVEVAFTLDRDGRVLRASLRESSGHRLLDEEALEMLRRAEPLPPPPPEMAGDRIDLVVPVRFFVK
ncbi:energy transducer TonB [Novispirillum sp. DQ9]|uniref:energy transducer TonB n=1 Tax=Novispirillum sp. DQ9 TaxID=3398612 RepID=UPI003C7B6938